MKSSNSVSFLLFADFHYKQGMYLSPVSDLEKMLKAADEQQADFVLHCGDYCNDYSGSPEVVQPLLNNKYGLSVYGVYGNHELESRDNSMQVVTPLITNRVDEVVWGTEDGKIGDGSVGYYYFDNNEFRFICLDTNYSYKQELSVWEHNKIASWGAPQGNLEPNSLGPVQLEWFKKLLLSSAKEGKKCVIVSHATFNTAWGGYSPDSLEVLSAIENANSIKKGTVLMVINGHYHTNRIMQKDNILFFDVNTVRNGCWIFNAPQHYDESHTFDYRKYDENGNEISSEIAPLSACWQSGNTWYFNAPLYAMVCINGDGKITVEGTQAEWLYGVVPENQPDYITPQISSGIFELFK